MNNTAYATFATYQSYSSCSNRTLRETSCLHRANNNTPCLGQLWLWTLMPSFAFLGDLGHGLSNMNKCGNCSLQRVPWKKFLKPFWSEFLFLFLTGTASDSWLDLFIRVWFNNTEDVLLLYCSYKIAGPDSWFVLVSWEAWIDLDAWSAGLCSVGTYRLSCLQWQTSGGWK